MIMTKNPDILSAQQSSLSPYVAQFNLLTQKLDTAVKTHNPELVIAAKQELDVFFGTLTIKQQDEIRIFLEQQKVGQVIQYHNLFNRGRIRAIMNFGVGITRTMADTVPKVAEETFRLIFSTIGHTAVGLVRGTMDANRSFHKAS